MLTSLLITTTTLLPLLATLSQATPINRAAPVPQADAPPSDYSYPDPQPCLGNCSGIHDPNIVYDSDNGVYWRFTTSNNISIANSDSLEGPWTHQGPLLDNGTSIHVADDQDIWAPTVFQLGDTWYCYYAVSYLGSHHSEIGVATSPMLRPYAWTDHGDIGLPQNEAWNLIDPYVFQESSDSPLYFSFGSHWNGIYQFEINPASDASILAWAGDENDIKNLVHNTTTDAAVVEGAITYKHDDYYYLFFSVGQCCREVNNLAPPGDEYHVAVCRAEDVTGPYVDSVGKDCTESGGTTILASHGDVYAPGGQGVMWDEQTEREVMYYHYVRPSIGYNATEFQFGFNYLDWVDGWPVVVEE